jgi:hypothetical protein
MSDSDSSSGSDYSSSEESEYSSSDEDDGSESEDSEEEEAEEEKPKKSSKKVENAMKQLQIDLTLDEKGKIVKSNLTVKQSPSNGKSVSFNEESSNEIGVQTEEKLSFPDLNAYQHHSTLSNEELRKRAIAVLLAPDEKIEHLQTPNMIPSPHTTPYSTRSDFIRSQPYLSGTYQPVSNLHKTTPTETMYNINQRQSSYIPHGRYDSSEARSHQIPHNNSRFEHKVHPPPMYTQQSPNNYYPQHPPQYPSENSHIPNYRYYFHQ